MSMVEKHQIEVNELKKGSAILHRLGTEQKRIESILNLRESNDAENRAQDSGVALTERQDLSIKNIQTKPDNKEQGAKKAPKRPSVLTFQLQAKVTPLYYQNPNSNLKQMQLMRHKEPTEAEKERNKTKTKSMPVGNRKGERQAAIKRKGSTTILSKSGSQNQIPTKLMAAAAMRSQTWRVLKLSTSSQDLYDNDEENFSLETKENLKPIDTDVYNKMVQPKQRRSSAFTYVQTPHVANLAKKANNLLNMKTSYFQRTPLTARDKHDAKIIGKGAKSGKDAARLSGEREISEYVGSSLQSNEVFIAARHRKKYRALKKKVKRQQSQRHYELDQRKEQMQSSNINFVQCRYPDRLGATIPPKQGRRPLTGSRSAAILDSQLAYHPDGKDWRNEHHRFVKGANQNSNFVQTMKIKGLADRYAQLGQARPSTAIVLGGAGSVRTITAQQKPALTERELFNFQNARNLAMQHPARPAKNKAIATNYIQRQYEIPTQSNIKSRFLKHQMKGGHRTARTGATQADIEDSVPDGLQDFDDNDDQDNRPAAQQLMHSNQQAGTDQGKRRGPEVPDSQHSSVRTQVAPSGQASPNDKLKTMLLALPTKILEINKPVRQEKQEQEQKALAERRMASATAAPMKVQVKLTPPPQDLALQQENTLDDTAVEQQSPLTARLPRQALEGLADMGEELPARRNTQTIFKRIAPIVSKGKLKILKKHPDFDNFIALEQKFLEKEDSPHRNIKMSKRENAKAFLKDYLKYIEHNLEAPKGISNNVEKQLQRDKDKIQRAASGRSPTFVGLLIGKSIEKGKLQKWKASNDHLGFSRTQQPGGMTERYLAPYPVISGDSEQDAENGQMVYDPAAGKFVPNENRGGGCEEANGSGWGRAPETANAQMNQDAEGGLKVQLRVRRRATSSYQQRPPNDLNADLEAGFHEIRDTQYSRLANFVHDHHKKTISKTCARLLDEERLDQMRELPLADILGFMQPQKKQRLKQLKMGLKIKHIDQYNIQQAVYDAMCQSNFIQDKYLQKAQPGPDGKRAPASLTISDLRLLQKLTDPRKLGKILSKRNESTRITPENYTQRSQRPKSEFQKQTVYQVAQYLDDMVDIESEGSHEAQTGQEMEENGYEEDYRLGQEEGSLGRESPESGSKIESNRQKNKVNRNYGKRKSEAKTAGMVLDAHAHEDEFPHHHSVLAEKVQDRLATARTSLALNSFAPVEPEFLDIDIERGRTSSALPAPVQVQVQVPSVPSKFTAAQIVYQNVDKPEGQMWQELQQFVSAGIAGADDEENWQLQQIHQMNAQFNLKRTKEGNRSKKNQTKGQLRTGSRARQRQKSNNEPAVFENNGLRSAFRPKTANHGGTSHRLVAPQKTEINQDLFGVTGKSGKKTIEIWNMPKTTRISKAGMVQDTSPELFRVEKKRITEKPLETHQVIMQPKTREQKADFWEQELRILQEDAAMRSRSNRSSGDQKDVIQLPEAVKDRGLNQMSGSKSESRISESELFQSFQIKGFGQAKLNKADQNKKAPLQHKARNTDLTELRFDLPSQPEIPKEVFKSPGLISISVNQRQQQQSAQTMFPEIPTDEAIHAMAEGTCVPEQSATEPTLPDGFADSPNKGDSTKYEDTLPRLQMSPDTMSPETSPCRPDTTSFADQDQVESSLTPRLRPTQVALFDSCQGSGGAGQ